MPFCKLKQKKAEAIKLKIIIAKFKVTFFAFAEVRSSSKSYFYKNLEVNPVFNSWNATLLQWSNFSFQIPEVLLRPIWHLAVLFLFSVHFCIGTVFHVTLLIVLFQWFQSMCIHNFSRSLTAILAAMESVLQVGSISSDNFKLTCFKCIIWNGKFEK